MSALHWLLRNRLHGATDTMGSLEFSSGMGFTEMTANLSERISQALVETSSLYYRLVLLVGPPHSVKTHALHELSSSPGCPLLNVNLTLSERLLQLTRKQRALRVSRILAEILGGLDGEAVLLDHLEVLFDPQLAQDPLRLLQGLARNRTVVAAWPGGYGGEVLTYAEPGHPEWRRYRSPEAMIVPVELAPGSLGTTDVSAA